MEQETIWRITEDDLYAVIEEKFPHLTDEQINDLMDRAHDKFSIHDWAEQLEIFIECHLDQV